jgi:type I restriction enzyme S subunit
MSGNLPVGWAWATPTDLASPERYSLSIGPFGSSLKVSDYRDSGVPLIFVRNIRSENFDDNDPKFVSEDKATQLAAHEVHPGDVLITKMGDPPGDSALYPISRPVGVVTADCIRWKIDPDVGDARFIVYATRTPQIREQILDITRGVAQRKVSLARFKSIRYRLAPLNEQHRIVAAIESYLTRLDDAVATLERVQRNLKRYRAAVLKAAVEGRLVPTEAELARAPRAATTSPHRSSSSASSPNAAAAGRKPSWRR